MGPFKPRTLSPCERGHNMSKTTYTTTRRTIVERKTVPSKKPARGKPQTAKIESFGDGDLVIVDGIVPAPLAALFAGLVEAHNRGELTIT